MIMPIDRRPVLQEPPDLRSKRVGVLGLARSGLACVRFLLEQGAEVIGADRKSGEELTDEVHELTSLGAQVVTEFERLGQLGQLDLLVTSPGIAWDHPALAEARGRRLEVIGELELAYRFCRAPLIAICGTNGKGTTTLMTGEMLAAAGIAHLIAGNIGLPLISQIDRSAEVEVIVAEVSSFQLETIRFLRPWIGALLNITPDHLDRHHDFAEYVAAKRRLFENQGPTDFGILCTDDATVAELKSAVPGRLLTVSTQLSAAAGRVQDGHLVIDVQQHGSEILCHVDQMPVPGLHNVRNALVAALAARLCGATAKQIARGLATFRPADHLLQAVVRTGKVTFIDDSKATNPAAAVADLTALDGPLIVIAGGEGKGSDFAEFGRTLARRARLIFLIGESKQALAEAISNDTKTRECTDLREAVQQAYKAAQAGDQIVLLPACASFDMFENQVQRGEMFTQLARETVQRSCSKEMT